MSGFRGIVLLVFCLSCQLIFAQKGQNILYGEHTQLGEPAENTSRIFYDRNGDLYPEFFISDADLSHSKGCLKEYFKKHPADFQSIAQQYNLKTKVFSEAIYQTLQDSILSWNLRRINEKSKNFKVVHFLVHGFRKPFTQQGRSSSSVQDNATLKAAITKEESASRDHYFIETYWDSMYDCCFSKNIFKNRKLFKLFKKQARRNAVITGYQLRKVVSAIQKDQISLISHSLGARILTTCLFNAFEDQIDKNQQNIPTPKQKTINVAMIAPAISRKPFHDYHNRTTYPDFKAKDNYHLFILFNEEDFVLRKKYKGFGPGPRKQGNTSLGCNHKQECLKLKTIFEKEYPNSKLELSQATTVGICHLVRCYTKTENFVALKIFISP